MASYASIIVRESSELLENAKDSSTVTRTLSLLYKCFILPLISGGNSSTSEEEEEQLEHATEAVACLHDPLRQLRLYCRIMQDDEACQACPSCVSRAFFWDSFVPFSDVLLSGWGPQI